MYSSDGFEFDRIRERSNWLMAMETLSGDIQSLDSDEISALSRRINMFARWSCVRATRFFLTDKMPRHEFKGYANLQIEITSSISRICVGESDACHRYPHYASAIRFSFFHSPYWISLEPRALYLEYKSVNPYAFVRSMTRMQKENLKLEFAGALWKTSSVQKWSLLNV